MDVLRDEYLLVHDDDSNGAEPLIVNISRQHPEAMVFTDDEWATAVKRCMQQDGVPVVTWDGMKKAHLERRGGR